MRGGGMNLSMVQSTVGVRTNPGSFSILDVLLRRSTFIYLLTAATLVPFFIGGLTVCHIIGVSWLVSMLAIIALFHVPMTAYLFSDAGIRDQMRTRSVLMIGGCVFWIALSIFIMTKFSKESGSHYTEVLYLFTVAVVMWQHWHFGKQSLGVFAFSRIATRTGSMSRFERYTLVSGAVCGIIAAYLMVGKANRIAFSPEGHLDPFTGVMDVISLHFRWFQYGLAVVTVIYIILNWKRFTPTTALLYLSGVCFFFPQFLWLDLPQYFYIFGSFASAHGAQYMVFLLYHALGAVNLNRTNLSSLRTDDDFNTSVDREAAMKRLVKIAGTLLPLLAFCLTLAVVINFYGSTQIFGFNDLVTLTTTKILHMKKMTDTKINGIVSGLIFGILLSHFWLDSFYWRLKEKTPREWVKARYSFLFN
jgi:hypothetical protein